MKTTFATRPVGLTLLALITLASQQRSVQGQDAMSHRSTMTMQDKVQTQKVGLDGYCPVCVVEHQKWQKGKPEIQSKVDGVTYHFPSESIKAAFDANPGKYTPALGGDCIVCYAKFGKRVPGKVQHAALHRGRLYLFPSDREKQAFLVNADQLVQTVARIMKDASMKANSMKQSMKDMHTMTSVRAEPSIRVTGRSGCAACEFGVTPIDDPDQLGLAVVGRDGSVTVVESAHEKYPRIYEARFDGQQLAVEGKIVKTKGNVRWLKPTSLRVVR
ncbi:MAG: hypothetical protein AAF802_20835 [Planctomycetota bacterium]